MPFSSHLWGVLGLKARKDHCAHEKAGKKTMPQLPWSAGGGGWLQQDTRPCSLYFPRVKQLFSHTDQPSCPCFASSSFTSGYTESDRKLSCHNVYWTSLVKLTELRPERKLSTNANPGASDNLGYCLSASLLTYHFVLLRNVFKLWL